MDINWHGIISWTLDFYLTTPYYSAKGGWKEAIGRVLKCTSHKLFPIYWSTFKYWNAQFVLFKFLFWNSFRMVERLKKNKEDFHVLFTVFPNVYVLYQDLFIKIRIYLSNITFILQAKVQTPNFKHFSLMSFICPNI